MKTLALAAVAAASLVASAAHADTFSGPSIGVQGGWEENSVDNTKTATGPTALDAKGDTGTLGIFAGYDYKLTPKVVVGAQAELNFPITAHFGDGVTTIDPKRSIDLSLRTGYLVDAKTLAYVRAGYSNVRESTAIPSLATYVSGSQNGWLLGAGVERAVTDHVTGRIEYRYTDLSEGQGKWDRHQVLAGVAYHF
ncbi:outer membrane protein [Novosphingobium sp. FSW06-99]|uniref:outer membrane protein n=1 Tax=Novosphingobium sp. FSW06-99 TaxID=1739113 RepID=UPI0009E8DFB8|nr:porin family protein [Novosphingobium sp. FSW06-99]